MSNIWTQAKQAKRGDGTTTRQIQASQDGGLYFVGHRQTIDCTTRLALSHRKTLKVFVIPDNYWNRDWERFWDRFRGQQFPSVTVDHQVVLTKEHHRLLCLIRIVPPTATKPQLNVLPMGGI